MTIFSETVGIDASTLLSFIQWVLTFVVVLFGVVVLRGSYQRLVDGDMTASDVWIDVVLAMSVVVLIGILVR